jgi:glycosyltransferase involved in cell wall biosynthesis
MKKILIISPTPTHPQNAGNRIRIFRLASLLRESFDVHFAFIGFEKADIPFMQQFWQDKFLDIPYQHVPQQPVRNILWRISKKLKLDRLRRKLFFKGKYGIDDLYDSTADAYIRQYLTQHTFDAVLLEYVYFSKVLLNIPAKTLKLLDTIDIYANRDLKFTHKGFAPNFFYTTDREEAKGLNRADVVIAIQENERDFFESIVRKETKVITVGHPIEVHNTYQERKSRHRLLFLASNNQPNVLSIQYFIKDILPVLVAGRPDVILTLAGRICEKIEVTHKNVRKIGEVESEDFLQLYTETDIIVSPILVGTGIKIKNLEAMGYGKPLVTTSVGAEGLEPGIGTAFLVGETPEAFAIQIVQLLENEDLYKSFSYRSFDYAQTYNKKVAEQLLNLLKEL